MRSLHKSRDVIGNLHRFGNGKTNGKTRGKKLNGNVMPVTEERTKSDHEKVRRLIRELKRSNNGKRHYEVVKLADSLGESAAKLLGDFLINVLKRKPAQSEYNVAFNGICRLGGRFNYLLDGVSRMLVNLEAQKD